MLLTDTNRYKNVSIVFQLKYSLQNCYKIYLLFKKLSSTKKRNVMAEVNIYQIFLIIINHKYRLINNGIVVYYFV